MPIGTGLSDIIYYTGKNPENFLRKKMSFSQKLGKNPNFGEKDRFFLTIFPNWFVSHYLLSLPWSVCDI